MRHPTDKKRHALHDALQARVRYLPEYLYEEPLRVLQGGLHAVRLPGFGAALGLWFGHLMRDPTPNRGPPLRPGHGAGAGGFRPTCGSSMRISCIHRPRWRSTPA